MRILVLQCTAAEHDLLLAELWERGVAGIEEQEQPEGGWTLKAYFDFRIETEPLARYRPRWEDVERRDWVAVSQSQWEPVEIGARIFLVPEWRNDATPPGRVRVLMRPGRICGTGWHATTRMSLAQIDRRLGAGATVLDVGTGTGILADAAALLGASRVYACDIDIEAAATAAAYLREKAAVFAGSLRSVRAGIADLVVANINAASLIDLAEDLARVRRPGGTTILSGFRDRHVERLRALFDCKDEVMEQDGWFAMVC